MIVAARASERDAGFVRLAATVPLRMDPVVVAAMLERGPDGWELRSSNGGIRRFAVDLRLRLGGEATGLTTFGKAAWVDLGTVRRVGAGYVVPIEWQASSAAPLFPVFSGELRVEADRLSVNGLYAPPGGPVGRIADRALLHVAATGTARWLLGDIVRAAREAAG